MLKAFFNNIKLSQGNMQLKVFLYGKSWREILISKGLFVTELGVKVRH